jgi:3-oxoacyl-[acyl-carrier protein] reductase
MTDNMRLRDRVAIVTGAGGGLGAAYAVALAREGAHVGVVDMDGVGAEKTAATLRAAGARSIAVAAELADEAQVFSMVHRVLAEFGRVDIVVNNAGGAPPGGAGDIARIDRKHWDRTIEMNLTSAMLVCKAVAPHMIARKSGKIVNVSSRAARSTGWFAAVSPEYIAAKAGVISLTRHLAKQLGPHGINVNCLVPAFAISGPRLQAAWDTMTEAERQGMLEATPLRRLPRLEELASVVVFLVSDESSYVTGAAIDVNGGSFMS